MLLHAPPHMGHKQQQYLPLLYAVLVSLAVAGATGLIALARFVYFRCYLSIDDPLAQHDSAIDPVDESSSSDDGSAHEDIAPAAVEMQPAGGVTWEVPKGLSPGDPDYHNRFIRGGL